MLVGRAAGVVVVLTPGGAVAGVDARGAPVGTRELDLLDPSTLVQRVHAVVLASGGLAAVDGVVRWLAERGHGFPVGSRPHEVVPIVPAAAALGLVAGGDGAAACDAAAEEAVDALAVVGETAVGLVVVGADLTQAQCRRVAVAAGDGFVRAGVLVPTTVFALAVGEPGRALNDTCTWAADALERAARGA
ncbi:P1 family peptidase [Saccharothrix syringae]|uniref:Peptidase S58, DmpA n=1 Tax=Saccharothrix syringae TaxID=103733 RepID=A0A5Q0HDK8_SACSY|nr:P1 family peptidase [Saccharothrix syringae]QFZ24054.1 peptidase S58, DmpA [Saccharothrix syringae]